MQSLREMMKQNRLELVLRRNHRSVVLDLVLALWFVAAAAVAGIAMNGALRELTATSIASAAPSPVPGPAAAVAIVSCPDPRPPATSC